MEYSSKEACEHLVFEQSFGSRLMIVRILVLSSTLLLACNETSSTINAPDFPPEIRIERIALAGCSQTRHWVGEGPVLGYEDITGEDLFTSASEMGGGSVEAWTEGSRYIELFRRATDGTEDAILAQVCVHNSRRVTYADLEEMVRLLRAEVPGVPVYLQPLDAAPPSCRRADYETSVALIDTAASRGLANRGPHMIPVYAEAETLDGCHPNDRGAARQTETVRTFLDAMSE